MIISRKTDFTNNLNNTNIDVLDMVYAKVGTDWKADDVRSGFSRIYMITKGSGVICSCQSKITMTPGNIYIVPAGLKFSYSCNNYLEKLYFHINIIKNDNRDIFEECDNFIVLENAQEHISELLRAWEKSEKYSDLIVVKNELTRIILDAIRCFKGPVMFEKYSDVTKAAIEYINDRLSSKLSVNEIAGYLYVSESMLQKKFREETGFSVGQYIDNRLMYMAEHMLSQKSLTLREISDKLGFCDQFYFSRKFSRRYGISPAKYRKQNYI